MTVDGRSGSPSAVTPSVSCAAATASPIAAAGSGTVDAEPHDVGGLDHAGDRFGDLLRRVDERWADAYQLLQAETLEVPGSPLVRGRLRLAPAPIEPLPC